MLWIIIFFGISFLSGVAVLFLTIYPPKNERHKRIWFITVGLLILLSSIFSFKLARDDNKSKEETTNNLKKQNQALDDQNKKLNKLINDVVIVLTGKSLDTREIRNYLKERYQHYFDISGKEAEEWADNFEKTLPQKKAEHESIVSNEHKLAEKLELRWTPLYNFILTTFDNTILQLQKKHMVTYYEKSDTDQLIQFQNYNPQQTTVRVVTFPNKRTLYVKVHSAIILNGKLDRSLGIVFNMTYSADNLLTIGINEDSVEFRSLDQNTPTVHTAEDPLADQEFRTLLVSTIYKSVEYAYLEETINP